MKKTIFVFGLIFVLTNAFAQDESLWRTRQGNNGLFIVGYTGNELDVIIPEKINNIPVIGIDMSNGLLFSPFGDNKVNTVFIPASITTITNYFCLHGGNINSILVDPRNPTHQSIDGVLFNKSGNTLLVYPNGRQESSYTVPIGVVSIREGAFINSGNLENINIPSTVTMRNLDNIFGKDIMYFQRLRSINVDRSNTAYQSVDGVLFDKLGNTLLIYPASRPGLSYILPSGVTSIGPHAFLRLRFLTSIDIPSTVTMINISNSDFGHFGGDNLESINVNSSNSTYQSIDGVLFDKSSRNIIRYPSGKKQSSYAIPHGVTSIGTFAFAGASFTSVVFSETVSSIGDKAFSNSKIESINIPNSVTSIGEGAFYYCNMLTSINISQNVTRIHNRTFQQCHKLKNIIFPEKLTTIDNTAFDQTLNSITIGGFVTIGERAIPNNFASFYNNNQYRAGTYSWDGNNWNYNVE